MPRSPGRDNTGKRKCMLSFQRPSKRRNSESHNSWQAHPHTRLRGVTLQGVVWPRSGDCGDVKKDSQKATIERRKHINSFQLPSRKSNPNRKHTLKKHRRQRRKDVERRRLASHKGRAEARKTRRG